MKGVYGMWAGIVIYNPKLYRLKENITRIYEEVDGLILYNNGCSVECQEYMQQIISTNVIVIGDGQNVGLAAALNAMMRYAKEAGAEWLLTFDQDSIVSLDLIAEMQKRISAGIEKIGIICPRIVDKRRIYPANKIEDVPDGDAYVKMCITSGSCTNIEA